MSNGSTAAIIAANAAALAAASQERVRQPFRDAGAISPAAAIVYKPDRADQGTFDQALRSGEIKDTGTGLLWLDEAAIGRAQRKVGKAALWVIGSVLVLLAGLGFALLVRR